MERTVILILRLPTHEYGISFHLFSSSSLCLSKDFVVCFHFFVKCITKYFILFVIRNGIVFFISFLDCSMLVYRNKIILYIGLVSWELASFRSFVESFGFSTNRIMSFVNRNSFFFLLICMPLTYFVFLLPWLEPPVQHWIKLMRTDILFMFHILAMFQYPRATYSYWLPYCTGHIKHVHDFSKSYWTVLA